MKYLNRLNLPKLSCFGALLGSSIYFTTSLFFGIRGDLLNLSTRQSLMAASARDRQVTTQSGNMSEDVYNPDMGSLSVLPDEILYRVLAHNLALASVSKGMQMVLSRVKPKVHITCKDILQFPRHPGDDQFVLENARRQVALIKRTSQFYTITGLAFTRRYDSSRVRDSLPTLTFNDWNEIFESCPQLDYLDFSKSQKFKPDHFPGNLGYALEQNPQIKLTYLNLYDLKLTLSHMFLFFRYFKHTRSFSTLKTLELGKNNFFPESKDDDRWIFEDLILRWTAYSKIRGFAFDI